ncbi:ComEC/Rec2 family competence protein [Mesorhizobium sp. KR1-2]|uniref:ComEC/Rec2 family competence protein n=1 Tax=Mesorhizobium sp. KR1-2 TaxID=3156609 RepID=UPI0032B419A5
MARGTASDEVSERELFASGAEGAAPREPQSYPEADARSSPRSAKPGRGTRPSAASWLAVVKILYAKAVRATTAALATELDRGTPFLFAPVLFGCGTIIYYGLPEEPDIQVLIGGLVVAAVALAFVPVHRQALRLLIIAALFCLLGMFLAKFETWRAGTNTLGSEISTRLTGRVAEIDHMANGRVRLTIDVLTTAKPKLRYAPERVRLSARKIPPGLVVGSEIEGAVRLMPPTGPVRPDSYDFSFRSYFSGIGASGFFMRGPDLVEGDAPLPVSARLFNSVQNLRNTIAERIRDLIGGPEGEIAAALVVGIRAGIPDDINEAMRRTGIYHIVAISGLHMALVAGTVMGSLRMIFALFPGFSSRHPVKKYAAVAALAAIISYLFISGGQVAAQRSCFMLGIMLTALLFNRGALTTRNLAISAFVIVAISPHELIGPSFQMSFAATAALVGGYALWSEYRQKRRRAPPATGRPLAIAIVSKVAGDVGSLMFTSTIAGIATTAFGVYHFQRVSPLSLIANLAVMPSVSFLVMPFAVLGSLAMPLGLDAPFFYVMGKGLTIMITVAKWISDRSPIDGVGLISSHSLALLTIALVIVTMATTWLRALALPFAFAGMLTLTDVRTPDVLISEDGRLVGVPIGDQMFAVNRARPNAFTVENWRRALRTEEIVGPIDSLKPKSGRKGIVILETRAITDPDDISAEQLATSVPRQADADASLADGASGSGFDCHDGLCVAVHASGTIVAHATDIRAAHRACDYASLIVIEDATAKNVCSTGPPLILTKRELAKYGSAAVYLPDDETGQVPEVRFALSEPYRPWHTQRRFSREARGLPPYEQKQHAFSGAKFPRVKKQPADDSGPLED